jgi:hypothetical protein
METLTLPGFLVFGLLTGLGHCTGMCGPFALWLSDPGGDAPASHPSLVWRQLSYHLGRTATYAVLGFVAGALGSALGVGGDLLGIRRAALLVAGGLLVAFAGAGLVGSLPLGRLEALGFVTRKVSRLLAGPPRHPFLVGLLLGLLPCGPLYAALLAAAGLADWLQGGLGMVLFGLGTWPGLMLIALAGRWLARARRALYFASLAWVLVTGLVFVWQGILL